MSFVINDRRLLHKYDFFIIHSVKIPIAAELRGVYPARNKFTSYTIFLNSLNTLSQMKYESTIAFIRDTTQIIQQYYHTGRNFRSHITTLPPESTLDHVLNHLTHAHLPLKYSLQPRSLTHILTIEILGHSLAPTAFMMGLLYNPK
jgi:hypothetical protein